MKITIAERLRPFSHYPGTSCLLPNSQIVVQVFPTLIKVNEDAVSLDLTGPVKDFTVQLDLEKGCIWIWGTYKEGYRRFKLWSDQGSFKMIETRGPNRGKTSPLQASTFERLSLGSHKKQDWCLVRRRELLEDIFPHWLRLAQMIPNDVEPHLEGSAVLLKSCENAILNKDKLGLYPAFVNLFKAGFDGILSPRLNDTDHLGLGIASYTGQASPFVLIQEGARLIRKLFIDCTDSIQILPCLPPQFHCGRFLDIATEYGTFDLEWSKKRLRRMIFRSSLEQSLTFSFQKDIKEFRFGSQTKTETIQVGQPLCFEVNQTYFFDRFFA